MLRALVPILAIIALFLVLPSVAHAQSTAPTVSSVAITSSPDGNNTYVTGDSITVSLTFSEAVTVTGTPYVVVDIGGQPRNFKYSGDGSSAAAQPFSYTVLVGDRDLDGVSLLVNSLTLNGGTIQATDDSANATLTHTTMTFATHKVDTEVTLLSSLADPDASGTMTISATESATVRIQVGDARDAYDINVITLDVSTASATLDVTVELVGVTDPYADYTYTGSVTATGSQTFTLTGPAGVKFGNVGNIPGTVTVGKGPAYDINISGAGAGSIELAGTSLNVSDPGVVSRLFFNRASNVTEPKVSVSGHRGAIPQLIYGDVVSSPPNGSAYAAGDRIDLLFVTTRPMNDPEGLTLPFWLGNGAEHRREAGLVKDIFIEFGYRLFSYTVQAGDTDADGIYIGADPLGDNAGIDSHAADTPAIPAYLRLAANQLPASQSVDGSGSRTCEEVLCSTVLAEVSANDRFSGFSALLLESSASFLTLGASSAWSFEYGGEGDAVVEVALDRNHDLLELDLIDGLSAPLYNRLALSVDGTVFLLSEANSKGPSGEYFYFQWLYPGLTWAEDDQIDVKLIETATATFDAASYAKAEGDTFDVTVTLGDSFVNTLTLPIVVAGNGGADATDYSGIPENLVFAPGDTEKTFTVTIVDDEIDDDGESLTLSFDDPHIRSGGANETAAITITRTLVSNTAQGGNSDNSVTGDHGQAFTTGHNLPGYNITGVTIISEDPEGDDIALQICEVASNGWPTTTCTDLTSAGPFAAGPLLFNVPTGTTLTLEAHTTYMVVFKSPGGEQVRVDATDSDDNDDTSLPDWEIRNKSQFKDSNVWRDRGYDRAIAIAISGTVNKTFINDNVTFDPDSVTREINENTGANRNVGAPVTATYTGTCTLIHRLGGTDADSFGIDSSTGQIRTRSGVTYDHEARSSYTVTVTAYHSSCGTDDATVTINVNDVDEPPRRAPLEVVGYPVPRTYDQIFVRWTPPDNAGRPEITGYDIQYNTELGFDGIWQDGPQNVAVTSAIISGLEHGDSYHVRVRAKNDEGSSPWSAESFTSTNTLDLEVEASDPIIPDGVVPGDRFRLLLVTRPLQARDTKMGNYADEALVPALALHPNHDLQKYWKFFLPLVSTRHIDARVITNTTYTNEDKGVPIHWVGGAKAADDYEDFYDGDWDDESARNASGELVPLPNGVWTGSAADGTELMDGGTSRALGQSPAGYGAPGSTTAGEGPIHSGSTAANTARKPIFSLTSVFMVVHPPLATNEDQTRDTDDRRSDRRSQAFTTGSNRHGYEFSGVAVGKHYLETIHIEVSVYSVDTNGHPDTLLFALSNPDSYTNDTQAFNAPAGSTLDPGTTYALVVQHATSGTDLTLYTTASDSEDDESLDGWSIADAFHYENGGSWQADSDGKALQIIVRGIAKVGPSLAPTELTAIAVGLDRIDLSWTAHTDDGGSAITGYRIESSADGSAGWADLDADTSSTDTTHSHTGLMPNTTRYYRVSAINGEGTSEPSDTANATTDYPEVTIQFEGGPYTVAEGGTQTVTVVLSEDPFRTTVIPLMATGQNGAQSGDYTIPPSVTFSSGETSKPFDFMATQDTVDDDDESVRLTFGPNLPSKVSVGTMEVTTVSITDDDDPEVEVSFASGTYIVPEGGTQEVTVTLSADPERQVVILITATPQGGVSEDDYSGVPDDVTFNSGQKSKSFTFSATDDTQDEDGEKVLLTFGTLPTRVTAGATGQTTISISDDCADVDIWCATMAFGATVHWEGRYDLQATDVDNREFSHNGADYQLWSTEMHQNGHDSGDDNQVVPPFGIPERTEFLIDFFNLSGTSDQVFDPPDNDWLDWTLHVGTVSDGETLTATLRFSEARKLAGAWWRWSGGDIDGLRRAWKTDQLYKLRLVEDPRSERTPQPLNPPLYLSVQGEVNTTQTWLRWLTPQTRHDRVPPVDSYKIQWKHSSGSWDTSADVSETTRGPSSQRPVSHYLDGLTPGVEYNIRVIATDSVGDSEPSNEVTYTKPASGQLALSNTPAEGEPRIDGTPEVGQTLSVDTTAIVDVDGLEEVVFQYQWLADDADIAGATGATFNVVSGDVGKAISVRVSFTDDVGNEETLTSAPTVVTAAGLQLQSATVNGATLTLTYNVPLDNSVFPPSTAFAVNVNGSPRSVTGVGFGESNVLLLLSQAVEAGDTVTVDYTAPDGTDAIQDSDGRKAVSFSGREVTNNTASSGTARSEPVQAPGSPDSLQVVWHESGKLRASWNAPESGDDPTGYTLQWKRSGDDWAEPAEVSEANAKGTSHIITGLTDGVEYAVQVIARKDDGRSAPSGEVTETPQETVPPSLSSAVVDGATLTVTFDEALDTNGGPDKTAFAVMVAGNNRGVDTVSVSGSIVTITLVTAVFAGDAVTVDYTAPTDQSAARLQDLAGNAAASFSGQDVSNNTQAADRLTASASGVPTSHDDHVTFELEFSEEFLLSYKTLRDHAFTVTGGDVTNARRLEKGKNVMWEIHVRPDGDGAVTIVLPVTTDCSAQGAICTQDRRPLSNRLEVTVAGPGEAQQTPANSPATGMPTISGTAQVGETLTADTSGIADADGLTNATFSYQWIHSDGGADTDISGATGSSYTLADGDVDKTVKVGVSFEDDAGHRKTLTSAATAVVVARPNSPATGAPTISGTAQVGETLTASTSGIQDGDGRTGAVFSYQWLADGAVIAGANSSTFTLISDDEGRTIRVRVTFTDDEGHEESLTSDPTAAAAPPPNTPATSAPTITGAAQVGETLTASTTGISDDDGLDDVTFAYQWLAGDAEINGATANTYILAEDDEGKAVKVRVSFTDDAGNEESLTSAVTGAVAPHPNTPATGAPTISGTAQVGETLTASTTDISDTDGLASASFSYQWLADDADISGATGNTYSVSDGDVGKTINVWVSFTDDAGNDEALTSAATAAVTAPETETQVPGAPRNLRAATGNSGELAVSWDAPSSDGGSEITGYRVQWKESSGSWDTPADVSETTVTGTAHTITGLTDGTEYDVQVRAVNSEGAGEASPEAAATPVNPTPLTATVHDKPSSHDGSAAFTFELRFSENIEDLSYTTLQEHAFTVTGASVSKARRLEPGKNVKWEITVQPSSNADVTIVLPITTDCTAQGAICTSDGRKLSSRVELTISGPSE